MTKLIVSLDKLSSPETLKIIDDTSSHFSSNVIYKFNDLIALLGFE